MDIDGSILGMIAQFGFSAVAFYLVWASYSKLIPRLMDILGQNAEAMQQMAHAVTANNASLDRLAGCMTNVEGRLIRLEEQHNRNGRTEVK